MAAQTGAVRYKAFPSYLILNYLYQYLINAPRLSLLLHEMDVMDRVDQTSLSTFVRWVVLQHYVWTHAQPTETAGHKHSASEIGIYDI